MDQPPIFFSVIIPLYNKEESIVSTISSVLKQTYPNFEVVIINDGSTDNSIIKAQNINDKRIRIYNQKNAGVSRARNKGINEANYEWIAFLDGDDIWYENHLETMKDLIERYTTHLFFATSHVKKNKPPKSAPFREFVIDNFFSKLRPSTYIWTGCVVVNKKCLMNVGGFKENLSYGEDLELWRRIVSKYGLVKSETVTSWYRIKAENRAGNKKERHLEKCAIWYLDFSNPLLTRQEKNYYKKIILKAIIYRVFISHEIRNGFRILKKYRAHLFFS